MSMELLTNLKLKKEIYVIRTENRESESNWNKTKGLGTACHPVMGKVIPPGQKLFLVGVVAVGIYITGSSWVASDNEFLRRISSL